jgi:hypothetical protein
MRTCRTGALTSESPSRSGGAGRQRILVLSGGQSVGALDAKGMDAAWQAKAPRAKAPRPAPAAGGPGGPGALALGGALGGCLERGRLPSSVVACVVNRGGGVGGGGGGSAHVVAKVRLLGRDQPEEPQAERDAAQ